MAAHRWALALLSAGLLAVTACAPVGSDATPPATPAPTQPSAPSEPAPAPAEPAEAVVAFGGDCDLVLTSAQRDELLGAGSVTEAAWFAWQYPESDYVPGRPGAERMAGGLSCGWRDGPDSASGEGTSEVSVMVLPGAVVDPTVRDRLAAPRCDPQYDTMNCRLGRTEGDVWILARRGLNWPEEMTPEIEAELAAVVDAVAVGAATAGRAAPAERTEQWWSLGDCDAFGERLALADLLGEGYASGYWEGSTQHEDTLLHSAGVRQFCQYSSDNSGPPAEYGFAILSIVLQPGGFPQWQNEADDGEIVGTADGADEVFVRPAAPEEEWSVTGLRATDGINVLSITSEGEDLTVQVAQRALAALAS